MKSGLGFVALSSQLRSHLADSEGLLSPDRIMSCRRVNPRVFGTPAPEPALHPRAIHAVTSGQDERIMTRLEKS